MTISCIDFMEHSLRKVSAKVIDGKRLSREDGLVVISSNDLLGIGYLADMVRERLSGDKVYYTTSKNINSTNICVLRCKFCAFRKDLKDKDAYVATVKEAVERIRDMEIKEVHMVGGLHPHLKLEHFEELVREVKFHRPDIYIQGFTAVEIDFFARLNRISVEEVLIRLKDAGLDGIPGGGAEVFSTKVRKVLCPQKISGKRWLEIMETAHCIGVRTNATILYGHIETFEDRVDHLLALREVQDRTKGFKTFVPLSFQASNTHLAEYFPTTGFDDLKMYAVSRLLLDNFPHIKALWNYVGLKIAQTSLCFGVDDLGGTALDEQIAKAAGASHGLTSRKLLERIICDAGRKPVYSNSGYTPLN